MTVVIPFPKPPSKARLDADTLKRYVDDTMATLPIDDPAVTYSVLMALLVSFVEHRVKNVALRKNLALRAATRFMDIADPPPDKT